MRRSEKLLLCAGKGASRAAIARRLDLPEERYATHASAHAVLGSTVAVGAGSIILAGTVATSDVRIGRHVVLMPRVVLTHDDVLGTTPRSPPAPPWPAPCTLAAKPTWAPTARSAKTSASAAAQC